MKRRIVTGFSLMLFCFIGLLVASENIPAAPKTVTKKSVKNKKRNVPSRSTKNTAPLKEAPQEEIADLNTFVNTFDQKAREKAVTNLLDRGIAFCANKKLDQICQSFTHTKDFVEGELYLFLLDTKGVVYAHGDQSNLVWKNLLNTRDMFGALIIQSIIKTAQTAPGWVTYEWNGAVKVSFVQKIKIDNKEFIIGCGYYPQSKEFATIGLVKGAVALFNKDVADGSPIENAYAPMNYSLSERFVFGDLYLYALDFNGNIRAQGDRPGLIGSPALDYKDAKGKLVNQEIIKKLKEKKEGEGIWVDYISKNAQKRAYAEKVQDSQGNFYFIACGYYPELTRDDALNLVRRGYQFMKASGTSVAAKEFTDTQNNTYRLGDLSLVVYDMKGNCIANGRNQEVVGQNQFDVQDKDGRYYVREMIEQAKSGGGWVDFKLNNSFQATYVEKVDMGVETFIIESGIFPVSKPETMTLLVKSAVGYLNNHTIEQSFDQFVNSKGEFIWGDLFIFVFDQEGFCYTWGDSYTLIWQNLLDWKDDNGKDFIKSIINTSAQGPDNFVCSLNKHQRVNYFEQVEKNGVKYTVGSGFFK